MAIRLEGNTIAVSGSVTFTNVFDLTQQGASLLDGEYQIIDLSEITEVDSSAVSMLLEWLRIARNRRLDLRFVNFPNNLSSLLNLYGLNEIISPT